MEEDNTRIGCALIYNTKERASEVKRERGGLAREHLKDAPPMSSNLNQDELARIECALRSFLLFPIFSLLAVSCERKKDKADKNKCEEDLTRRLLLGQLLPRTQDLTQRNKNKIMYSWEGDGITDREEGKSAEVTGVRSTPLYH
ncbi:unnamed protein product [Bursaphelenchus xylophilus]|uniref:(pine wood nematode) hypothetical protein n=1 Tax=Bursaphelenchus xylophilus TaxID=6326 RepID=A0A1I7SC22_BURXY|nr:unnamed protein product [Bursaphelenchus xylophilus]CAG9086425.1 unnamed protein product [Bursaphelenchus xylophilus]